MTMRKIAGLLALFILGLGLTATAQHKKLSSDSKHISPDLFGIFFEDINYAADGGLYAELIQNRSFEYSPGDRKGWNSLTAWEYMTEGFAYGTISVETQSPLNENNRHYVVLNIEDAGQNGLGLKNSGFDGIVVRAGEKYDFSAFVRQLSDQSIPLDVKLLSKKGVVIGETTFSTPFLLSSFTSSGIDKI